MCDGVITGGPSLPIAQISIAGGVFDDATEAVGQLSISTKESQKGHAVHGSSSFCRMGEEEKKRSIAQKELTRGTQPTSSYDAITSTDGNEFSWFG